MSLRVDFLVVKEIAKGMSNKRGVSGRFPRSGVYTHVFKLETEVVDLSMRILSYTTTIKGQIPMLVSENFQNAECA